MHRNHMLQIFAIPIWIAVLSAVGLVAALVGDDAWDVLSWVTLAIPVVICAYFPIRGALKAREARTRRA